MKYKVERDCDQITYVHTVSRLLLVTGTILRMEYTGRYWLVLFSDFAFLWSLCALNLAIMEEYT